MRTVREDPAVQGAVDDALERWHRADDAWQAVLWALVRDPYIGTPLTESGQARSFTLEGRWAHDMPTIVVLYVIGDQYIDIKSVNFDDADTGPVGHA